MASRSVLSTLEIASSGTSVSARLLPAAGPRQGRDESAPADDLLHAVRGGGHRIPSNLAGLLHGAPCGRPASGVNRPAPNPAPNPVAETVAGTVRDRGDRPVSLLEPIHVGTSFFDMKGSTSDSGLGTSGRGGAETNSPWIRRHEARKPFRTRCVRRHLRGDRSRGLLPRRGSRSPDTSLHSTCTGLHVPGAGWYRRSTFRSYRSSSRGAPQE